MEERNLSNHKHHDSIIDNNDNQELALAISPLPSRHINNYEPYVIQFPREQIFKVPPLEHATFIERKLNNDDKTNNNKNKNRKNGACCSGCCSLKWFIFLIFVIILVFVGIYLVVLFYKPQPAGPEFSMKSLFIKKHKKSKMHPPPPPPPPTFNLTLAANPIIRKGIKIHYPSTGTANIYYHNQRVASGKFPILNLENKEEGPVTIRLFLTAVKGGLPKEIQNSLKFDSTVNEMSEMIPITLDLDMTAPIKVERYKIQKKDMHVDVKCNFRVNTLGDGSKVTKQHCQTNLRS